MDRLLERLDARVRPTGLLRLLDESRQQHRVIIWTVSGVLANMLLVVIPLGLLFGERTFAAVAGLGAVSYFIAFVLYLTRGAAAGMLHLIVC